MTPKELMYLEDSMGLEQQLQTKCNDYASKVQDESLRTALTNYASQHQQHFSCLMKQLNA